MKEEKGKVKARHPLMADVDRISRFQELFGTELGKAVLYDLLQFGHFMVGTGNGENSRLNEGRREVCLYILEQMAADPNDVLQIIATEAKKEKNDYGFTYSQDK